MNNRKSKWLQDYLKSRAIAKRERRAKRDALGACNYVYTKNPKPDVGPIERSVHAKLCKECLSFLESVKRGLKGTSRPARKVHTFETTTTRLKDCRVVS